MVWAVSLDADRAATRGEGDVYIGPDLWTNDTAEVAFNAPCTLVFPPYPLETPVTITWPEYETSVLSTSDGTVHTKSTKFVVTAA
ncbi:chitinase [Penicillium canescens]|uniref:Chitinase n=1 Tax=Penicillium canescens TaxID=5083 RepID=A0AAD6IFQ0_PENCN|nr:chitinase [Penicillium canescens]KAJ6044478.1 chitinase [Penicillium canescens]KAJ6055948.1 chitinase [Penicillium canescens]KAJ6074895.1 chitinase [Penicillium canescens]